MSGIKFDINTGEFIFGDDNFGVDSDGHMMMGIDDDTMMDMETGDIHFTTSNGFNSWNNEEE